MREFETTKLSNHGEERQQEKQPKVAETAGAEETGRILNVRLAEYAVSSGFS